MYNKILVPLDGSALAECVLPHVEAMATNNKAKVTFLYIIQPLDVPLTKPDFKARIESEAKAAASDYLEKLINKQQYKEAATGKVILGKVAENIVDYATKNKMDLIIMATHGRSGVSRWVSGSMAEKVLHAAKVPIWLIRAGAPKTVYKKGRKITMLVPLDGSALAEKVLSHVNKLAKHFGPESVNLTLLRSCELFFPPYTYPPPTPLNWEEYLEYETKRCKDICQDYLSKIEETLKKEGLNVNLEVPVATPADAIVEYANKNDFDLIVMATHGRTGLSRWALGSVADKVLKAATTPIFLVRNV